MDCTQCGASIPDSSKFCPECGARQERKCAACGTALAPAAKFCPECGTKVAAAPQTGQTSTTSTPPPSLAPSPLGLAPCAVAVAGLSAEGPDSDGDMTIRASYTVKNGTFTTWDLLSVRAHLLGSGGQVIATAEDTLEQPIDAGDDASLEASWWAVKRDLLGPNPDTASVVIEVLACARADAEIGSFQIPDRPFEISRIQPAVAGDTLRIVSGSIWKSEPDDDDECSVEVKLFVQNLTDQHLPVVRLSADILDSDEDQVADAGTQMDLAPSGVCLLTGYAGGDANTFYDATVRVAVQAHRPHAFGACTGIGLAIQANSTDPQVRETHTEEHMTATEQFSRLCRIAVCTVESDGSIEAKSDWLWCVANLDDSGCIVAGDDEYRYLWFSGDFRASPDFFIASDDLDPDHPWIGTALERFDELAGGSFDHQGMKHLVMAGVTWPDRGEDYLNEFSDQPWKAQPHLVSETLMSTLEDELAGRSGVLIGWENNLGIVFDPATGQLSIDGQSVSSYDDLVAAFTELGGKSDELLILVEPGEDEDDA